MGLLTGGLNGRRFRITTPLPSGFRDLFLAAARDNLIADSDANDGEPRAGWVSVYDPAATSLELNDLLTDPYLALSLRVDTKKVQGTYRKIALTRRVAAECEERGVEKLSKSERTLVEEALDTALFGRALPSITLTDMVWNIDTGEVVVFGSAEASLELIRTLMRDTFGTRLHPERMVDWLADKLDWQEILDRVDAGLPGGCAIATNQPAVEGHHEDDPLDDHAFLLGSDFITWLWLQSESSDGLFRVIDHAPVATEDEDDLWNDVTETLRHADLTLWIDSRLKLQERHGDAPATTILIGEAPSTTAEARQNLHQGKWPVEASLGLEVNDLSCRMTLLATPGGLQIKGLKIPTEVKQGREEKLLERAALLDLVHNMIKKLFQQFFMDRTSPAWDERVARWLAESVDD